MDPKVSIHGMKADPPGYLPVLCTGELKQYTHPQTQFAGGIITQTFVPPPGLFKGKIEVMYNSICMVVHNPLISPP